MFVYTFRSSKLKWLLLIALCAFILGAFWYFGSSRPASQSGAVVLRAGNAAERLAFISQFGWDVAEDPVQVTEILIPAEFDEVYQKYNEIQKQQDLDLTLYAGRRVKKWTYAVRNYPGYEGRADVIELNMLICDGLVIGDDVCSTELGGFMHGFDFPAESASAAAPLPGR